MKLSSLPWILIPGLGQIHQGRVLPGLAAFILFVSAVNIYFTCPLLFPGLVESRGWIGIGIVLLWLASAVEFVWHTVRGGPHDEEHAP